MHKKSIPLRPVLSMPGSLYKVNRMVVSSSRIKKNSSTQKTVDCLKRMTLESDEVIVSFDVTSLNTNAPNKEATQEAADRLYSGDVQAPSVDKKRLLL